MRLLVTRDQPMGDKQGKKQKGGEGETHKVRTSRKAGREDPCIKKTIGFAPRRVIMKKRKERKKGPSFFRQQRRKEGGERTFSNKNQGKTTKGEKKEEGMN